MPLSESKKRANKKYDKAHYSILSCQIEKDIAESFRNTCKSNGTTPNAAIKGFIKEFIESAGKAVDGDAII